MATSITVFDSENHELHTIVDRIKERPSPVELICWRPGIDIGAEVRAGTPLADVFWTDGTQEVLAAPEGCSGRIVSMNRRIEYDRLRAPPSQVLLRLS